MRIELKIKGVEKVVDNFKKFGREGKKVVALETAAAAFEIVAEAKRNAPVGTPESTGIKGYIGGSLKQSITPEKIKPLAWIIEALESYASFVEFGTSKMSAQPFLYPAWKKQIKIYLRDLNKSLERLGNKYSN